jgi:hypothetical protein
MSSTTTVTIAQALASGASNLHVVDTAADIAAALPNAALSARVRLFTLSTNATVGAAMAEKLATLGTKFQLGSTQLVVRDTLAAIASAPNAAGVALATLRQVADAAYNLLNAPAGSYAHVNSVVLLGAPTLNVAQYARLQALPGFSVDPSTHITLADSLSAITGLMAAHPASLLPVTALAIRLDGSTIGAYGATQIGALEGHGTSVTFLSSGQNTTLPVSATAQDLAANAVSLNHLAGQVGLNILVTNEGATLSAAQAAALLGITGFNPAAYTLSIADAGAALTASAALLFGRGFHGITVTSGTLTGTASQLLDPALHIYTGAGVTLAASVNLSASQAAALLALPHFAAANGATVSVADTITNLLANGSALSGAGSITVTDSETINGAQAVQLAVLANAFASQFSLAGHTVTVQDSTAALLALPQPVLALIGGTVLGSDATVTAAQFVTLRDILHVALGGHSLTIQDSAANLLSLPGGLALAHACVLSGDATVSAAQAAALAGEPGFSTGGHALIVSDTAANLLALPAGVAALATSEQVNHSATVSAADLTALAAVPDLSFAHGVAISAADTAANLLALSAPARALAASFQLAGNATVTAAQFVTLRDTLHLLPDGWTLTIADGAENLLSLAGQNLTLATASVLSGSAFVTAAQATALAGEPGFSTGGYTLVVSDSAANLLALPQPVQLLASMLRLTEAQTVSAAQLTGLAALGITFTTSGNAITVADGASALAGLAPQALALATAEVLNQSATVSAATAAALTAFSGFSLAGGVTLTVQDSVANLLSLPAFTLADASTEKLAPGAATLTAAQAAALAALPHFSAAGTTITVSDTVAGLTNGANTAWHALAAAVDVVDSAANLAANASSALLQGATSAALSGNGQISVAQAVALAGIPHLTLNGAQLIVADTAAAVAAHASAVGVVASLVEITDSGPVTAAEADALATLAGADTLVFQGGNQLQVADSYAALTTAGNAAGLALAARISVVDTGANLAVAATHNWGPNTLRYVLSADSVVSAAQVSVLTTVLAYYSAGGHSLTADDTVNNLLNLSAAAQGLLNGEVISQSATIDAATLTALSVRPGMAVANGATLTVQDNAPALLALAPAATALATLVQLNGDTTITAAQAQILAADPGFSNGGHALIITGSAAALLALPASMQAQATELALNAGQTVNALQLTALAALGGSFTPAGHGLIVADSAVALAGLGAGALALATGEVLDQSAVVTAAIDTALAALPSLLFANGVSLTVQDNAAALLALAPAALGLASSVQLSGNATVTAAQFTALRDVVGVALDGHTITVADSAANLLSLAGSLTLASACMLNANATVTAPQATALAAEPAFSTGGFSLAVTGSAAQLLALPASVQALAASLELNGAQTVTVTQLNALVALGAVFSTAGQELIVADGAVSLAGLSAPALSLASIEVVSASATINVATANALAALSNVALAFGVTLSVQDTAAALLGINAAAQSLSGHLLLSSSATISAADFVTLRSLGVGLGGHALTVSDTATSLLSLAGSNLALASAFTLSDAAIITAAQAVTLAAEPGFSTNGHALTITGTAAALLGLAVPVLALASSVQVTSSVTLDASDADTLAALAHISLQGGVVVTVHDSAAALLSLSAAAQALASAYTLSTDAIVDAAQFSTLRDTFHVGLAGHALTVQDSAGALLALAGSDVSLASACVLSGDATVTAAQAVTLAGEPGFSVGGAALTIQDTAGDLLALPVSVQALAAAFVLTGDGTVTADQLTSLANLADFSEGGHTLTVSDSAGALTALSAPALALASAEILDASATVTAATAAGLVALGHFSVGEDVSLIVCDTAATLLALAPAVTAVATGYALSANAVVSANGFTTLRDTLGVTDGGHTLTISDTAANLVALSGSNLSLASACVLSGNATVQYWEANALAAEPGFSTGGHTLIVADSAYNLLSLSSNVLAVVDRLDLNGNQIVYTDELPQLAALGTQFSANGYTITVEGDAAQLTGLSAPAVALATGEVLTQSAAVTAQVAESLISLGHFSLAGGVTLTIDDTAATLLTLPAAVQTVATAYELSANGTVDASGFTTLRDTLEAAANGHAVTVIDTAANLVALAGSDLSLASACVLSADATVSVGQALSLIAEPDFSAGTHVLTISGSAATISQNLTALGSDFGTFGPHLAITLTGQSPTIQIDAASYAANSTVLDAITNAAAVIVNDSAAAVAPLAALLAADAEVAQVNVSDSADDVVENLSSLLALGSKLSVTLTDQAPLAASLVPFLAQLDNVTCGVGISDIASQIAAVVQQADATGNAAAITFLETNGVALSADSQASVADLSALEQLGNNLSLNGHAIYVYDTVSHLTASGAANAIAVAEGAGLISGVYIKAPSGLLSVSAANALTLFNTEGASTHYPPPQSGTIAVTVADTASNIEAHVAALATLLNGSTLTGVVVTASATISDSVLSDLQGLNAVAANGVSLTVSDSAAAISANAASQAAGPSITPSAWLLNGNATVSEAQAAALGGLAHFSAGAHTLTLNLNADTVISVQNANALGNIAGALNLNGHLLEVAGTAAQLSAVNANAWSIAIPVLTDTLANISALPATSPLFAGSVTISDSEPLTATQAANFLGLVAAGGGAGIHLSDLHFGSHTETVTGSIAQLQALTASAAWGATTPVHGAFSLIASDTVANLTNSANTSFLASLAGTSLSSNETVSAAAAESLAVLQAQINFNLGSHQLTVQDSAANLLAVENAAGVALANATTLAGPATVDAAGAETLLANPSLHLNTSLTIQDSSASLLDGTLMSDIANSGATSYIHVQLAGPETLDAETAASLAALPGFNDTQNLTIADTSAYLLASANLSAEQQAVAVTLSGDETVSANTVLRLSEVPHFTVGDSQLTLAGNDFADAATIKAIADLGSNFSASGHTIIATADALGLTPTEYTALQNDDVQANGHAISAVLVHNQLTDLDNIMSLSATGIAGATVNIYDSAGTLLSTTPEHQAGFTVSAPDNGAGHAFAITETVSGVESAPIVVLEASVLETAVTAASTQFANSGAIEVDSGKYLNLYLSTAVPQNLQAPALVYNATNHTVSLDIPGASAITLITLGSSTHPASLDISEILIKHHG